MIMHEMVLQIDGECVVYGSKPQKGSAIVDDVNLITIGEPFLVLQRTIFKKTVHRTTYDTFSINLRNRFTINEPLNHVNSSLSVHGSIQNHLF